MSAKQETLLSFIKESTSPYHEVAKCTNMLQNAGFKELSFSDSWSLDYNGAYYTKPYGTALFAFTIGKQFKKITTLRMASAHTDYPCFRIKPNPEIVEKGYMKLNTESYGGLIINTWLDRPLSIAGKVSLKSDDVFAPVTKLVDFKRSVATIPNLAIHINREVNKGVELNKQTDVNPLIGMLNDTLNKDNYFMNYLAKELDVDVNDILDFDLYIYNNEEGCTIGMEDDFISSPRLDNFTSTFALVDGIIRFHEDNNNSSNNINIICLYDNEEIGSRSKQGADSMLSNILVEKIFDSFGKSRAIMYDTIMNSIHLSVDVSHCIHPNYIKKNDPTNIDGLNKGVVVKLDSTQKYATDTEAIAIVQQLCNKYNIAYQKFVNRSDGTSGSTLGSIASSWLPMKTVDLGVPLLAMHSAREMMGVKDQEALEELMYRFFME